jgi:NAD(P)-dependent dehydrogenase (short-subunit alcohol dehydrogenase family)
MSKLSGKVAIVTGASKGIGAGIAKALAAAGASVVVNYASSKADAERVVSGIISAGGNAVAVRGDVSNASEVESLVRHGMLRCRKEGSWGAASGRKPALSVLRPWPNHPDHHLITRGPRCHIPSVCPQH